MMKKLKSVFWRKMTLKFEMGLLYKNFWVPLQEYYRWFFWNQYSSKSRDISKSTLIEKIKRVVMKKQVWM